MALQCLLLLMSRDGIFNKAVQVCKSNVLKTFLVKNYRVWCYLYHWYLGLHIKHLTGIFRCVYSAIPPDNSSWISSCNSSRESYRGSSQDISWNSSRYSTEDSLWDPCFLLRIPSRTPPWIHSGFYFRIPSGMPPDIPSGFSLEFSGILPENPLEIPPLISHEIPFGWRNDESHLELPRAQT